MLHGFELWELQCVVKYPPKVNCPNTLQVCQRIKVSSVFNTSYVRLGLGNAAWVRIMGPATSGQRLTVPTVLKSRLTVSSVLIPVMLD